MINETKKILRPLITGTALYESCAEIAALEDLMKILESLSQDSSESEKRKFLTGRFKAALKDKDFSKVVRELESRHIKTKKVLEILYNPSAVYADSNGTTTFKETENLMERTLSENKNKATRYRNILNFLKKNSDLLEPLGAKELIEHCIALEKTHREIASRTTEKIKIFKEAFGFNKKFSIDIRKNSFWTRAIIDALEYLGYKLSINDERIRDKNLVVIGHCLKALYPNLWNEDIKTIKERIRKKVYDHEVNQGVF